MFYVTAKDGTADGTLLLTAHEALSFLERAEREGLAIEVRDASNRTVTPDQLRREAKR